MTKQLIPRYVFDAAARTVTFPDFESVDLSRLLLVVNATRGQVLYSLVDPGKGGTVSGNVLTLAASTASMSNSDKLTVIYQTGYGDPEYDRVVVGNARAKFRDGFAPAEGGAIPDPAVWDSVVDDPGHLITAGGDAAGSAYLRISMSPFVDSSQVSLTSRRSFRMPFRVGFGISTSQRMSGQEVFVGMVGVDGAGTVEPDQNIPADKAITGATISITSNVGTVTLTGHGLKGGDRVVLIGNTERRLNVGPVTVTVIDANTFTVPITLANGSYNAGGSVRYADPLRFAKNGSGLLIENTTVTNASFVTKRSSSKPRILNSTISSTTATQSNTSPYSDAFNPAGTHELFMNLEEVSFRSVASDSTATMSGLGKWTAGVPDEDKDYKIQVRARNLGGMTRPVAKIATIAKSGSTTATVTTVDPHGLAVGDYVQVSGVRDQTNFPNLTAQTVVGSVPSATTFTVVIGSSSTTNSVDGIVVRNEGSVLGTQYTQSIQSAARTGNVLTLVGNATWATPLPGEFVHVWGVTGALSGIEGAYKVLRVSGTTLELHDPAATGGDFASTPTGGSVIKRTDVRLHFVRLLDYTRNYTEVVGGRGNTTDINNAVPVSLTGGATLPVSQSTGINTTQWSAAGWGGFLVADIASAAITSTATSSTITPGSVANVGTYAHSFSAVVTAVSGTSPTLDIAVEESPDNGTNWVRIYEFPRITATGTYTSPPIQATWGTRYRYVRTVAGTSPSFTMSLNRMQLSFAPGLLRNFIDRTALSAAAPTVGTLTPTYYVEKAKTINATMTLGAATTAPAVTLEGSEDNVNWYALPGGVLTGAASTTVMVNVTGVLPKFVRGRVTTAGAGLSGDRFVTVKAIEV